MTKTYQVENQIKLDGKRYAVGSSIELDDAQAAKLRAGGFILDAPEQGRPADLTPAERHAAIVVAIGKLAKNDTSLWTGGGAPKTEAITAVTGWPVSGKERDAAWAEIGGGK